MARKKTMNYKEMKEMFKEFEALPQSDKEELAELNRMTVEELRRTLAENVYKIEYLGTNQLKALRKEILTMDVETKQILEEVNGMTLAEITKELDSTISEIQKEAAINREFKRRCSERRELVRQKVDC